MIVVINVDGVLVDGEMPQSPATIGGAMLYKSFSAYDPSVYLISTARSDEMVRVWLYREGFERWARLETMDGSLIHDPTEFKCYCIKNMLASGLQPTIYFDDDPATTIAVANMGVTAMLMIDGDLHASGPRPIQEWDEIATTINHQKVERAARRQSQRSRWES